MPQFSMQIRNPIPNGFVFHLILTDHFKKTGGKTIMITNFWLSGFLSLPSPPYYPSIPHLFLYWNRWFHTSVVICKWQLFLLIFITVLNYSNSVFSYQTQQLKSWKLPDTLIISNNNKMTTRPFTPFQASILYHIETSLLFSRNKTPGWQGQRSN